jgi:hypothetical protein
MQGIPWERLNYTRDQYRQMRLKQYKNYESLVRPRDGPEKVRPDLLLIFCNYVMLSASLR